MCSMSASVSSVAYRIPRCGDREKNVTVTNRLAYDHAAPTVDVCRRSGLGDVCSLLCTDVVVRIELVFENSAYF